ncbi:hypothetical protein [Compostimonas suwonensis]|uniref:Uncharacterized protein n=1 Tax=Compostimonas suwonensis TaxID=1048394 RepID=A0A2M9BW39_9MICO|nr:hypothetical protein [Compostimonas suwonensis]PJJ62173.1 hypothetical protein CLV54_1970 [Compostimonas suwonensis]
MSNSTHSNDTMLTGCPSWCTITARGLVHGVDEVMAEPGVLTTSHSTNTATLNCDASFEVWIAREDIIRDGEAEIGSPKVEVFGEFDKLDPDDARAAAWILLAASAEVDRIRGVVPQPVVEDVTDTDGSFWFRRVDISGRFAGAFDLNDLEGEWRLYIDHLAREIELGDARRFVEAIAALVVLGETMNAGTEVSA